MSAARESFLQHHTRKGPYQSLKLGCQELHLSCRNHKGQGICRSSPTVFHGLIMRDKTTASLYSELWSCPGSLKS